MVAVPAKVLDLVKRPDSSKVLVSVSASGQPHGIVCGSLFPLNESTLAIGEVLMRATLENFKANDKVSIVVSSGMEAYQIYCTVAGRQDSGPVLEGLNAKLDKIHLHAKAVWTFTATAVFDESASPAAGTKIA